MLTDDGPQLIEFNCRFGDPEAQAVLAVLETDLAELALACVRGDQSSVAIRSRAGVACTVVVAAPGYPDAPRFGAPITVGGQPLDIASSVDWTPGVTLHPAGMTLGQPATVNGGRVLSVTALGIDLAAARSEAYAVVEQIHFDGMQVRSDIGWRAHAAAVTSYASTGVNIDEGSRAVSSMRDAVEATHGPAVLRGVGSFGGAFSAAAFANLTDPVLVGSTDGVGTKVELAARAGRYAGVGMDIVNHCVDDVLVQGARPLFFLDYVASSQIRAEMVAEIVGGMAAACAANGCALLGGETAEMPGVYHDGAFDIAGTLVGVVDRAQLLPRPTVAVGDTLIGIASSGPHTNGYSLLRRLFDWLPLDAQPAPLDRPLIDALLEPHRSYLNLLSPLLTDPALKAMAHITGGGLPENLPRVLPEGIGADIDLGSWPMPPLFQLVTQVATALPIDELYRTLNMGIGMVLVTDQPDYVQSLIAEPTWVIGSLRAGNRDVALR
ncbi:MAG TPA: phosphoribosylformylglycinamidine cyclo-ligase, partial [Ilumatobacteraceae bacterium]|nr:phosphoribosylformylglycinamidine cyclo-ligase [Ilumatobacteraceae bacterium]